LICAGCSVRARWHPGSIALHFVAILCLFVLGCSSSQESILSAEDITALNQHSLSVPYVLGIGDAIAIKFFRHEELNDEVTIRPDGKISLLLVDDVTAAGLTPAELDAYLSRKYSTYLHVLDVGDEITVRWEGTDVSPSKVTVGASGTITLERIGEIQVKGYTLARLRSLLQDRYADMVPSPAVVVESKGLELPEVTVAVKTFAGRNVYVSGEVFRPQMVPMEGMVTVLGAVIRAGGANRNADLRRAVLIRHDGQGGADTCLIDLQAIQRGNMPDVQLQPYDVVYLPRTGIAELSLFVQQYVHNLIPVQFNFIYNLNPQLEVK